MATADNKKRNFEFNILLERNSSISALTSGQLSCDLTRKILSAVIRRKSTLPPNLFEAVQQHTNFSLVLCSKNFQRFLNFKTIHGSRKGTQFLSQMHRENTFLFPSQAARQDGQQAWWYRAGLWGTHNVLGCRAVFLESMLPSKYG